MRNSHELAIMLLLSASAAVGFTLSQHSGRATSPLFQRKSYIKRLAHANDATSSASSLRLESPADPWATSAVLATSFPSTPRLTHAATLLAPRAVLANVFFDQTGPAMSASLVNAGSNGKSMSIGDDKCVGCVQVLPARLRPEALNVLSNDAAKDYQDNGAYVYFVQSVAVIPAWRRKGNGERLMRWAEQAALSAAAASATENKSSSVSPIELWLAVDENEAAALALHLNCGYQVEGRAFGNLLLRKEVVAGESVATTAVDDCRSTRITTTDDDFSKEAATKATTMAASTVTVVDFRLDSSSNANTAFASTEATSRQQAMLPLIHRPKPSWGALGRELVAQSVVLSVAALGIAALVAPLGGRSVPDLLGLSSPNAEVSGLVFVSLTALSGGAFVGLTTEALRRLVVGDLGSNKGSGNSKSVSRSEAATAAIAECCADGALRRQKAITLRVGGADGLGVLPLACVIFWQLGVALAEEAYYRGFVQSAVQSVVATVPALITHTATVAAEVSGGSSGGVATSDVVALVFASALFGAAHVPWDDISEGEADANAARLVWFLETGAWGLLYGVVFVGSDYNLLAPLGCHTAQNVWWCSEDLQTFGAATDSEIFEMLREEDSGLSEPSGL